LVNVTRRGCDGPAHIGQSATPARIRVIQAPGSFSSPEISLILAYLGSPDTIRHAFQLAARRMQVITSHISAHLTKVSLFDPNIGGKMLALSPPDPHRRRAKPAYDLQPPLASLTNQQLRARI
jgi:hypothetical protein